MTRISFVGDIVLKNAKQLSLSNDITEVLNRCDFNIINFEAPIAFHGQVGIEKSGINISQCNEAAAWVEHYGWNVISLANNHVMDYGNEELKHTISKNDSAVSSASYYYRGQLLRHRIR